MVLEPSEEKVSVHEWRLFVVVVREALVENYIPFSAFTNKGNQRKILPRAVQPRINPWISQIQPYH